jgi:aminoglycoside adenylyltransferase-like protein/nucleotidyltransferase-like protein
LARNKSKHAAPPTPYPDLNSVLNELVGGVKQTLGANFVGASLQGSFAVGDFDEYSDVDFVIVVNDDLTTNQVDQLQVVHKRIYSLDCEWAKHLEGSYFPSSVIRSSDRSREALWYLDHGSQTLIRSDHCNTLVVRSVTREYGVTLDGPDPKTLVEPVDRAELADEIRRTMLTWSEEIFTKPEKYRNRFYQGFIVLNYCRMLHDLVQGHPGSKRAGASWAKSTLGPVWSGLIDRAWEGRPNPAVSVKEPANPVEFDATMRLLEVVLLRASTINVPANDRSRGSLASKREP